MRRIIGAIGAGAAVAMIAVLSGCQGHNPGSSDMTGGGGGSSSLSSANGSQIALVNNVPITDGQLFDALQHYIPYQLQNFPQNPMLAEPAGRVALQDLILNALKMQMAKENGVPVDQGELDSTYADNKMLKEAEMTLPFESVLQQQCYTEQDYKDDVLAPQVAEDNLMGKTVTITPPDLEASYNANQSVYTIPQRIHFHRIACATQQQADDVYKGLKAGTSMTQLASQNIAAPGSGGNPDDATDMAYWIYTDKPPSVFAPIAKAMTSAKAGDVLAPLHVAGQWWVLQVKEERPSEVLPFNQVQNLVRLNLIHQKAGQEGQQQLQGAFTQFVQKANIKILWPQYKSIVTQIQGSGLPTAGAPPVSGAQAPAAPAPAPVTVPSAPSAKGG